MTTGFGVDDVKIAMQKFGWIDYMMFLLMLISCSCIGIYFGFIKREKKIKASEDEANYLVGGRKMKVFPITLSLIASYISGISLLGTPTEIYVYGVQYMYIVFAVITMGFIMSYIYLPVFHDLQLTSTYQYLETRYDKRIRLFGALLFIFGGIAWLPIVIYVPALAFNQVTGVNVHLVTPIVCIVCIFYTCVGGLKAVVWTDVVQTIIMFGAMCLVVIKGTWNVGGFNVVWQRAMDSGRIERPDFDLDMRTRNSMWALYFGGFTYWLKSNAVSQNMIQRYLSLPTVRHARRALWLFIAGVLVLLSICCYSGLLIFATYHDCDPLTTRLAKAKDQLLPLLVMDILGDYPGLPGIFVAGVFSAALSSLSTGLNSMSAVILEDFFKSYSKKPLTDRQTAFIMRAVVAIFGGIFVALVLVVEKLGAVLQLSMSLGAVTNGPLLGIFTMGILIPWVHGNGVIVGGATGLGLMAWICAKAQTAIARGEIKFTEKPVHTDGCSYTFASFEVMNMLAVNASTTPEPEPDTGFVVYHISYLWYTTLGALVTILVSVIASFLMGANKIDNMNPKLFSPFLRKLLWKNSEIGKREEPVGTEDDVRFASALDLKELAKV